MAPGGKFPTAGAIGCGAKLLKRRQHRDLQEFDLFIFVTKFLSFHRFFSDCRMYYRSGPTNSRNFLQKATVVGVKGILRFSDFLLFTVIMLHVHSGEIYQINGIIHGEPRVQGE